ncbi:YitT family protein [Heyndrickxia coagulans]|uniref:YitT family protein n=1 Tax=Heyndrickxia coagulans TaxID=1398 RepID=UPI0028F9226F|nr:YitT family protein [Heyndrickxia coagulans]MDT9756769.1 YitT family protein [Heyndrickxia coagulans]
MKKPHSRNVKKLLIIIAGAAIQGYSMGVFLFPNAIPSGGAGGLTVLFHHWFHVPLSIALWMLNSSMLVFAVYFLSAASAMGTLLGITVTSVSVNLSAFLWDTPFHNEWLDLACGSVLLGIGIGILLRQGVSNGGIGIVALIISKYRSVNPATPLFIINGLIFILTAYVIDWKIVVQAVICQYVSTRIVAWIYQFSFQAIYLKLPFLPLGWRKK